MQTADHFVRRVRHELKLRDLTVARIERLGDGFAAITFTGDALADFTSLSFDDHVKFMFPDAEGEQVRRDYTPRRFSREALELTIEFALHGDGKASDWARNAVVGQRALLGGPKGSMIVPLKLDWHLLTGDATALPAIARRLEELPGGSRAIVLVHAAPADRRVFAGAADVDLRWFDTPEALVADLQALALPPGRGFAWGGGEASLMARVRQVLNQQGVPREATRVSAYWKQGVAEHHENLE
ncbi:FAD-binding protein [Massilia sp. Root133]|uniref:siderophore-interacting protein n=1 Tax=unclassified Massilia TaxID=2609279 RepID=UPI0006F7EA9F|nr:MULTISPECIES: siderophore-interacting protein [unclassified Massilia]KQY10417.1 FAD-binding protein [Massilia sp. Root133]KQZ50956.1 FAD-binding protein [Massilia sp. Root1485]